MNRRTTLLLIALALSVAFAGWQWFRPYEWNPDSGARFVIDYTTVKEDHGFAWVDVQLKRKGDADHDLLKPVLLVNAAGREFAPSETTLGGDDSQRTTSLSFRFWLEKADLAGPLRLKLNDGSLTVRSGYGLPVPEGESRSYHTDRW